MGQNYEESVKKLKDEVAEIRKLGREMQLTEEEINECARNSLDVDLDLKIYWHRIKESSRNRIMSFSLWFWNSLKVLLSMNSRLSRIFVSTCITIGVVYLLWFYFIIFKSDGPLGKYLEIIFEPENYHYMRVVRLVTLPLHSLFSIGAYHNFQCAATNPFYIEEVPENCWNCHLINSTKKAKNSSMALPRVIMAKPLLFQNYSQYETTLKNITDLITNHYDTLDHPEIVLEFSTVSWLKRPIDLVKDNNLEERIKTENNFHIEWISRRIRISQVLRNLFPRPKFVNKKSEILITRKLLIDGPHSKTTRLNNIDEAAHLIYYLHKGNRTIEFVGKGHCEKKCTKFQTTLLGGDMISLPSVWDFNLLENGDEISIASVAYADVR